MSEADRQIFKFFDGERERAVDPLVIMRRMRATGCDFQAEHAFLNQTEQPELAEAAWSTLVAMARDVFGLKPLSDDCQAGGGICRGLTEQESFDVFDRFGEFIDGLKKNTNPKPTSQPSSEPPACQGSVEPTNMSVLSASG